MKGPAFPFFFIPFCEWPVTNLWVCLLILLQPCVPVCPVYELCCPNCAWTSSLVWVFFFLTREFCSEEVTSSKYRILFKKAGQRSFSINHISFQKNFCQFTFLPVRTHFIPSLKLIFSKTVFNFNLQFFKWHNP